MDDFSPPVADRSPEPQLTSETIQPVPEQPPEQEFQTANPQQRGQIRSQDYPPSAGVSASRAMAGKNLPNQTEFTPTIGTTVDEILRAAYFVASGIDQPVVEVVNPHVINLHYPADGSLATVKIEARSGAWGGIGPKGTPEFDQERNDHYDAMAAAAAGPPPPPEGGVTEQGEGQGDWQNRIPIPIQSTRCNGNEGV